MTSKLTQKQQDELFATLQSATKKTQDIRAEKTKLNNPAINLSNDELFNDHVKWLDWKPLQNHGLYDSSITLNKEDMDWPMQIKAYLNLLKNVDIENKTIADVGCGWGRGVDTIAKYLNADITGIDNNRYYIQYANAHYPNNKFICKDKVENDYDIVISNCSAHLLMEGDFFYRRYRTVILTDFFTRTSINEFKDRVLANGFCKIVNEVDLSEQTIQAMMYDIDTIDKRFPHISQHSRNIFKDIAISRLHLFRMGANRQYKYTIQYD